MFINYDTDVGTAYAEELCSLYTRKSIQGIKPLLSPRLIGDLQTQPRRKIGLDGNMRKRIPKTKKQTEIPSIYLQFISIF